jgi:hypothetical protein
MIGECVKSPIYREISSYAIQIFNLTFIYNYSLNE